MYEALKAAATTGTITCSCTCTCTTTGRETMSPHVHVYMYMYSLHSTCTFDIIVSSCNSISFLPLKEFRHIKRNTTL